ncbi:hypothetical protein [Pseudomonas agarici]|uniref:hypothetical protein n=1 Tax=Pseudomonas agarici TaxID=46677 RepID=UPI000A44A9AD|nr:hypothetical protein [Pseudomonas agarici]NWB90805.1 hypothetical protein [Pseudomonas agarici]
MSCGINGVTFGHRSKEGFKNIGRIYRYGNMLSATLSGGVITNLFFNNGPLSATYSISQYDFTLFTRAMAATPTIVKNRVNLEVAAIITDNTINYKEREFWKCIYNAH